MSRTENRYGQATIPPGSDLDGVIQAVYGAIYDAMPLIGTKCNPLYDQIQFSSEIVREEEITMVRSFVDERNVLTVRLPVVFDD